MDSPFSTPERKISRQEMSAPKKLKRKLFEEFDRNILGEIEETGDIKIIFNLLLEHKVIHKDRKWEGNKILSYII
jgi:hypothetical protein